MSEDNTVVVKSRYEYDQLEGQVADGVYDDFNEQTDEMGDKGIVLEDIWSRIPDYQR
ncbi:hypothetical protein [Pediococcus ethanolidurans]|uniref:hypothetical protein n=1 Tax=Pediococcus ethanolidurans TaxID=319653 RepID=UPI002955D54B|nr:hypothetical protein [Pediococcus ethanolidurans]